jgi:hypothetical protein
MIEAKDVPFQYASGVRDASDAVTAFINSLDESDPAKIRSAIYHFAADLNWHTLYTLRVDRDAAVRAELNERA